MQEEREKGGGGPHFSKWHLEQSGGQLAAHAGVWGSGPLSHALWLGVEPRDGPAHQTWSGVQFGGVSSRQHLREAPGVPPKLAARLSHSYSPARSPVERLVADRGCRMRSGEEAGPRPPLTLGFPVSSWRGRPQGTVWASGCLPASHAAMRRAQREAEPVSCWPRGTRHQLDQDRGLGRAPPLWVCVGKRWLPGAQLRPPTMSLAPHGRPSESPQSTRTPFQEPPSDGGLVAAPSLHLSPPSLSSTTPQEQQDRAGTRHPAGGASPGRFACLALWGCAAAHPQGCGIRKIYSPAPPRPAMARLYPITVSSPAVKRTVTLQMLTYKLSFARCTRRLLCCF